MRIVIDLIDAQIDLQTAIGCYSISLAQAMCRNAKGNKIFIILSGLYPDSIEDIRSVFDGLLPLEQIRMWQAPLTKLDHGPVYDSKREIIELIRTAFIKSLKPDMVFVPGAALQLLNNSYANIGVFIPGIPTVVVAHDRYVIDQNSITESSELIHGQYSEYFRKAALCVTTPSRSSKSIVDYFGLDPVRIIAGNIDATAGVDEESFDKEALHLLGAFKEVIGKKKHSDEKPLAMMKRLKMAFISPLPPAASGIADYSAELLPELARYYDIEVIEANSLETDSRIKALYPIRTIQWFRENAHRYDRIMYHFGNSPFHSPMFELLDEYPGVVVLHDFYLGDVIYARQEYAEHAFLKSLYESHGYGALLEHISSPDAVENTIEKFPCNFDVIKKSLGIIVHSIYARKLAEVTYGKDISDKFSTIPLMRVKAREIYKIEARKKLELPADSFIFASFGMLGPTKLNEEMIEAFISSSLSEDKDCYLIMVGENSHPTYGVEIVKKIEDSKLQDRIIITGRVEAGDYKQYLAAVDVAIQLRQASRGETSAAVLDTLNFGLPTIVNANGAMDDLPADCVIKLDDDFSTSQLKLSMEKIRVGTRLREKLSLNAKEYIQLNHSPASCAKKYAATIEKNYNSNFLLRKSLLMEVGKLLSEHNESLYLEQLALSISGNFPELAPKKHTLYIDVSATYMNDLKTGIQRVVRSLKSEMINADYDLYRVEPVYLTDQGGVWHFRYANKYTLNSLGVPQNWGRDEPVSFRNEDIYLCADFTSTLICEAERKSGLYQNIRNMGVRTYFIVYDLLPIELPEMFPLGTSASHELWARCVAEIADGVIAISRSVADSYQQWLQNDSPERLKKLSINWFHLGADLHNSIPTQGMPVDAGEIIDKISLSPGFLMVGTLEPRKGHEFTLRAFEHLWSKGIDCNLVIVGKEGWQVESLCKNLCEHKELHKHLFWLKGISDEFLQKIYATSICLIAASEGEGFGLPLIEAAQHGIPIIARDIPVFREVAGEHAIYFDGKDAASLASTIQQWLKAYESNQHLQSDKMPWLTWKQSAGQLLSMLGVKLKENS